MTTIYWNVDTQYDFMRDDDEHKGALPVPGAKAIEANLERLTEHAYMRDIMVVNTADWHTKDSKELSTTPDYKTTFPPHCLIGTKGARFVPATEPKDSYKPVDWRHASFLWPDRPIIELTNNIVIYKDDFDVFKGNPHTEKVLQCLSPDHAIVYGVCTNVCVHYAVKGLLERGVNVTVVKDAIKELPGLPLESLIDGWKETARKKGVTLEFKLTDDIVR